MAVQSSGMFEKLPQAFIRIAAALFYYFALVVLVGLGIVLWSAEGWRGVASLWFLGYLLAGGLAGFLFSLPRVMSGGQGAPLPGSGAPASNAAPAAGQAFSYQLGINTNLERVSDWLTSGIVALGLVEFKQLGPNLAAMADMMVGAKAPQTERSLAVAIILFAVTCGFLIGFLGTRIVLSPLFRKSDQESTGTTPAAELDRVQIGEQEGVVTATASVEVKKAAEDAKEISLESLKDDPEAIARWARARLLTGEVASAVRGFEKATKLSPQSARNRYEYAMSLLRAGKPRAEMLSALEEAAKLVKSETDLDLREKIYVSLSYAWLYQPAPTGFERAIAAAEEYCALPGSRPSGGVLVNLACGYGQKAAWLKQSRPGEADAFREARKRTMDAMVRAIETGPGWKSRLNELLNDSKGDNDLEVFIDDVEFQDLVRP